MEVTEYDLIRQNPPGATPLSADDLEGLIPALATREELNAWEQENIVRALDRVRRRRPRDILDDTFLRTLHRWMFGETWRWAGAYRRRETNIGVDPTHIPIHVRQLCENFRHQRDSMPVQPLELAVRFHRDLVWIHPFPNGNGRHSRLAADLLLQSLGGKPLSWGGTANLETANDARTEYLAALQEADAGNYEYLVEFASR